MSAAPLIPHVNRTDVVLALRLLNALSQRIDSQPVVDVIGEAAEKIADLQDYLETSPSCPFGVVRKT